MAKKKVIGIEEKPNYVVEDYRNPPEKDVAKYRRKKVDGHLVTIAVLKNGKTTATSVWHPKTERKSKNKRVQKALARARRGR